MCLAYILYCTVATLWRKLVACFIRFCVHYLGPTSIKQCRLGVFVKVTKDGPGRVWTQYYPAIFWSWVRRVNHYTVYYTLSAPFDLDPNLSRVVNVVNRLGSSVVENLKGGRPRGSIHYDVVPKGVKTDTKLQTSLPGTPQKRTIMTFSLMSAYRWVPSGLRWSYFTF